MVSVRSVALTMEHIVGRGLNQWRSQKYFPGGANGECLGSGAPSGVQRRSPGGRSGGKARGRRHGFESGRDKNFFLTPHFLASGGGDKILLR